MGKSRTSITTLVALLALAACAQALAPAGAGATISNSNGSGCQPGMGLPPGIGLNEHQEICTYEVSGGRDRGPLGIGYGGGGGGEVPAQTPEWWQDGEEISVSGKAPICDAYHPCLPSQVRGSNRPPVEETSAGKERATGRGRPSRGRPRNPMPLPDKSCDQFRVSFQDHTALAEKHSKRIAALGRRLAKLDWTRPEAEEDSVMISMEISRLQGERREQSEMAEIDREDWERKECGSDSALAKKPKPPGKPGRPARPPV